MVGWLGLGLGWVSWLVGVDWLVVGVGELVGWLCGRLVGWVVGWG